MATRISESEYKKKMLKLNKIEKDLDKKKELLINKKQDPKIDARIKLEAMRSLIGFLVMKGNVTEIPMEIIIDVARDYERKVNEEWGIEIQ